MFTVLRLRNHAVSNDCLLTLSTVHDLEFCHAVLHFHWKRRSLPLSPRLLTPFLLPPGLHSITHPAHSITYNSSFSYLLYHSPPSPQFLFVYKYGPGFLNLVGIPKIDIQWYTSQKLFFKLLDMHPLFLYCKISHMSKIVFFPLSFPTPPFFILVSPNTLLQGLSLHFSLHWTFSITDHLFFMCSLLPCLLRMQSPTSETALLSLFNNH